MKLLYKHSTQSRLLFSHFQENSEMHCNRLSCGPPGLNFSIYLIRRDDCLEHTQKGLRLGEFETDDFRFKGG